MDERERNWFEQTKPSTKSSLKLSGKSHYLLTTFLTSLPQSISTVIHWLSLGTKQIYTYAYWLETSNRKGGHLENVDFNRVANRVGVWQEIVLNKVVFRPPHTDMCHCENTNKLVSCIDLLKTSRAPWIKKYFMFAVYFSSGKVLQYLENYKLLSVKGIADLLHTHFKTVWQKISCFLFIVLESWSWERPHIRISYTCVRSFLFSLIFFFFFFTPYF